MQRLFPNRVKVYTTLDWNLQTKCQAILQKYLKKWRDIGITNAALVVIDNETHSMSALIGSYDFFDELHSGQVNGALAPRSPGSTLKPILYAIGMDQGIITPASILYDVPVSRGGYTPENYDGKCQGIVTVREALTKSLNVPAVELLGEIGVGNFISFLQQGGITTIKPKKRDYGLSMILGGCEVNLVELTSLYSAIANDGVYRPLRYCQDEYLHEGKRILSDGAAYIMSELLAEVVRPDLPVQRNPWHRHLSRHYRATGLGTVRHRSSAGLGPGTNKSKSPCSTGKALTPSPPNADCNSITTRPC